ncbi:MAG TPA: MFS transporter [Pirellulales bacterium]|nr:MFS transporter [Pirellulales bacterium]
MTSSRANSGTVQASHQGNTPIGRDHYMALLAALLGWLFDGAEMGVFSMVGRRAMTDLLRTSDEGLIGVWFGVVTAGFLVGAATGGVLFGWLGDRIGRVRAMTLSILTYALFTGLCGLATSAWQLGTLRFIAALGMGGEWSLGVALVMEIWPNRSRAFMAGLIGAAANAGYLLVGALGLVLNATIANAATWFADAGMAEDWIDWLTANGGWRLLMMCGTAPALLTFLIRLFVPESQRWEQEHARGATSHWATRDLLAVVAGALGPALIIFLCADRADPYSAGTILAGVVLGLLIATVGYMYPVVRYVQRLGAQDDAGLQLRPTLARMLLAAGLSGVALLGTWGAAQWIPTWADKLSESGQHGKEYAQVSLAFGAIVGTILAALAGDWFGRRWTYVLMCVTSLVSAVWLYQFHAEYNPGFLWATFLVGACTASFYGWLPLYLPELFRTSVRATGQGFGFNFGRIIAAVGALQTGNLMATFKSDVTISGVTLTGGYPLACTTMSMIYIVGVVLIWIAPETRGQPLPD